MGNGLDPTGFRSFVAGSFSGVSFLVAGQPFDTIKVRMQTQQKGVLYRSSADCLSKTVTREGLRSLFKGMSTPLVVCIPSYAAWFAGHSHGIAAQQRFFNNRDNMSVWSHGVGGLVGGTYMTLLLAPGERVKCILQIQTCSGTYKGPIDVVYRTLREGGIRQLYKGTIATGLRDVPGSGLFFVLYETLLRRRGDREAPSTIAMVGGTCGIAMWFVGLPADVVKTRYQTAPEGRYRSFVEVIPELYKQEGVRAFFKGFGPAGIRAFLANGVCLLTFELVIKTWQKLLPLQNVSISPRKAPATY